MFKEDFDKLCLLLERLNNNLEKVGDFISSFPFGANIEADTTKIVNSFATSEIKEPELKTEEIKEPELKTEEVKINQDELTDNIRKTFQKLISQGYDKDKIRDKIKTFGVQTLIELSVEQQVLLLNDLELIYKNL